MLDVSVLCIVFVDGCSLIISVFDIVDGVIMFVVEYLDINMNVMLLLCFEYYDSIMFCVEVELV